MKRHIQLAILLFTLLFFQQHATSQIKLPRLVSDSMVLQRDVPVNVWGWASKGEVVQLRFNNKQYMATTNDAGKWTIALPATKAGGSYTMQFKASNSIEIKNIVFGDVWVCSGQSNMELPMARVMDNYPEEINQCTNPFIRAFNILTTVNFKQPQDDLTTGNWMTSNSANLPRFYAGAYFFAKELYAKYKVPIGLIQTAVGGSPAESWLSEDALQAFPHYTQIANQFTNDNYVDSIRKRDAEQTNAWYNEIWKNDIGQHEETKWYEADYDASNWSQMDVPGLWSDNGLNTNGVVWFRRDIDVPASMTGVPARLFLGNMYDRDSVYINGKFVGTTGYQYPPRKYNLPAGILNPGKNSITIRIINYVGKGGFYRDKPYRLTAANESIDLKGKWHFKLGAAAKPAPSTTTFHYQPGVLYNAMIAPLIQYAVKGVIWYQGESNTGKAKEYETLFPAVINNWRAKWNRPKMPFLYVQLANYMEAKNQPSESNWAALREAQLKALSVPNTAMAVAIDIGEWNDVHPVSKKEIGHRLALAAQGIVYANKQVEYSGPVYQSMKIDGNKIILSFTHAVTGLVAKNGDLKQFAIAGADKKFVWAKAIIKGNTVIVWNDEVKNPVAVRYAWADNPEGANLYNKQGLPASPFRTDNF
jgi:sialate O-acetylesterase